MLATACHHSPRDLIMPFSLNTAAVLPIVLLILSNIFMTFAWYGHLKYTSSPLYMAVVASWGIAFFEYCLAVPANRIGHEVSFGGAAEDHAGGDHAGGVCRFLGVLAKGIADLEPCHRFLHDRRRCGFRVQGLTASPSPEPSSERITQQPAIRS